MLSLHLERDARKITTEPVLAGQREIKVYRKMTSNDEQRLDLFDRAREIFVRARLQRRYQNSGRVV